MMAKGSRGPALLEASDSGFDAVLEKLLASEETQDLEAERIAAEIIQEVRTRGDVALLEYIERLDGWRHESAKTLEVPCHRLQEALQQLPQEKREALQNAKERIHAFHMCQLENLISSEGQRQQGEVHWLRESEGLQLGQRLLPIRRVGIYVPGGRAAYPSSVLMTAVPAKVAGVEDTVMTTPAAPGEEPPEMVLAAAALAGVQRVFAIGGAQAIAALAFGTETVPAVDKIVGPGNRFVAAAKRLVYGRVGTDAPAGPSEVVIIADGTANPEWTALDLLAQAEHDEAARSILLCPDREFLQQVKEQLAKRLSRLPRREIIEKSLTRNGALIHTTDLHQAAQLSDRIAPEHLGLSVAEPEALLAQIHCAGAIFLGPWSSEALGDYCAGPSHVLPTASAARFASPLGVQDFMHASSIIRCDQSGASLLADTAATLARAEGLEAHAQAAECRKTSGE